MVPGSDDKTLFPDLDNPNAGVFLRPDLASLPQAAQISALSCTMAVVRKIQLYVLDNKYKGVEAKTVSHCLDWLKSVHDGLDEAKQKLVDLTAGAHAEIPGSIAGSKNG